MKFSVLALFLALAAPAATAFSVQKAPLPSTSRAAAPARELVTAKFELPFGKKKAPPPPPPPPPKAKFELPFGKKKAAAPAPAAKKAPAARKVSEPEAQFSPFIKKILTCFTHVRTAPTCWLLAAFTSSSQAPVKPVLTRKVKGPAPVSKKAAPKAPPSKFSPKGVAAPGVSKQRPFAFGGRTPGPELYDDGLTATERRYIERGQKQALTGAAKLRFTFTKQGGKGYKGDFDDGSL